MSRERVCSFVRSLDLSVPMLPGVNFDWDSSKSGAIKLYIILLLFPFFSFGASAYSHSSSGDVLLPVLFGGWATVVVAIVLSSSDVGGV